MVRKHIKNCSVPIVPTTVDLQVILNEVLDKCKILRGANRIIISNSAHTITSFRVFVINIIKMKLDWRIAIITNVVRQIHPENVGVCPSHLFACCIPEGVSEKLMKIALIWHWFSVKCSEFLFFFFILVFFSWTFMNHRTVGERGGYFFNSSLPLSPTSQTLRQ